MCLDWRYPARVMHLAAAGRVKSGAVEEYSVPRIDFRGGHDLGDFTLEVVKERVAIVETVRHTHIHFIFGSAGKGWWTPGAGNQSLIWSDNARDVARRRKFLGHSVRAPQRVQILQSRTGIEQHDFIRRAEEPTGSKFSIGREGSRPFGRREDAFYPSPGPQSLHDLFVCHSHGNSITLSQNIENDVITIGFRNPQSGGGGGRITPHLGNILSFIPRFNYWRASR